jgi:hypothetical protein
MVEIRKLLFVILGIAQCIMGLLSGAVAVLLGLNVIEVQSILNAPPELLLLYLLIIGLFGAFSIISGLFLVREGRR